MVGTFSILYFRQQLMLNYTKNLAGMEWNPNSLQRSVQGVLSVLLSLKKNPIIRYQHFSPLARRLAESIRVSKTSIFSFNFFVHW